jgi:Abnormal spindle-like microcephaly-assoc'd, ASPM-SPD-2-Hydin
MDSTRAGECGPSGFVSILTIDFEIADSIANRHLWGVKNLVPLAAIGALLLAAPLHANPVPGTACQVLPADNIWNTDISTMPVHARSAAWLTSMNSATTKLHPDFGGPYGIPYDVVSASHPDVFVDFLYDDESDPGPYPFGADIQIEGGDDADGDRHATMIDADTCMLYEIYAAYWNGGAPEGGSGAIFDLDSNALRPAGWTSADAAGLPIFPGLVRLDEVNAGQIDHAIRLTAQRTDRSYVWPARHQAGAANDPNLPPMGARFRLKASYDITGFDPQTRVILTAMKKYGFILADNGSNWYFQGVVDAWPSIVISQLKQVPASQFEAVDVSSLMVDPNSGQARSGPAAPSASVSPGALAYGDVSVGASSTKSVTLTSSGTAPLHVSTATVAGTDYTEISDSCAGATLAPGATCVVQIRLTPTAATTRMGSLVIAHDGPGGSSTVSLSGRGVTVAPAGSVSPGSYAFGSVSVGTSSARRTFTVTSNGTSALVLGTVGFAGTHPGDFVKSSDSCSGRTLAPGSTCTVRVRFRPTATGARSAQLRFPGNAATTPTAALSGTGL